MTHRRVRSTLGIAVPLVLLAMACGGSDTDGGAPAGGEEQASACEAELLRYPDAGRAVHRVLRAAGVPAHVVPVEPDLGRRLEGQRLVVVPTLNLCTDDTVAAVEQAASTGAHVIVTCSSGVVDEREHVRPGGATGAFRDLLGVRVEEVHPLLPGQELRLDTGWVGRTWSEEGTVDGDVEIVAAVVEGPLPGHPAVTRRPLPGGGAAWYVGTQLDDDAWSSLLARVLAEAGVTPAARIAPGLEAVRRVSPDGERSYLFLLDHAGREHRVPARGTELLSGAVVDGEVVVPARGAAVVREETVRPA